GTGLGMVGLAGLLADCQGAATGPLAVKPPHFPARAKHVIHLYMNGGPSQVDTFDPKPALRAHQGKRPPTTAGLSTENKTGGLMPSPFKFEKRGKSGLQ